MQNLHGLFRFLVVLLATEMTSFNISSENLQNNYHDKLLLDNVNEGSAQLSARAAKTKRDSQTSEYIF